MVRLEISQYRARSNGHNIGSHLLDLKQSKDNPTVFGKLNIEMLAKGRQLIENSGPSKVSSTTNALSPVNTNDTPTTSNNTGSSGIRQTPSPAPKSEAQDTSNITTSLTIQVPPSDITHVTELSNAKGILPEDIEMWVD